MSEDVDEIVVTALKRTSTVQDTPASITAIGANEIEDKGMELAHRLANGPSVALGYMKENLNRAMMGDIDECLDMEATHLFHCFQTEDHKNATKAFVEKKEPVFKGE